MKTIIVFLLVFHCLGLHAQQLALPAIFSDHMVLQRGMEPPIWGRGKPNTTVTVFLNRIKRTFACNEKGNWNGKLPEPEAGKAYRITVINDNKKIELRDVLGGDVFYAGGQSNMQYNLSESSFGQEAIESAANINIRLFTVPRDIAYKPRFDFNRNAGDEKTDGTWLLSTPETIKNFSAVAYFFARKINAEQRCP